MKILKRWMCFRWILGVSVFNLPKNLFQQEVYAKPPQHASGHHHVPRLPKNIFHKVKFELSHAELSWRPCWFQERRGRPCRVINGWPSCVTCATKCTPTGTACWTTKEATAAWRPAQSATISCPQCRISTTTWRMCTASCHNTNYTKMTVWFILRYEPCTMWSLATFSMLYGGMLLHQKITYLCPKWSLQLTKTLHFHSYTSPLWYIAIA